jgi:glycosyltransferase involved in cell wall biosynthesis
MSLNLVCLQHREVQNPALSVLVRVKNEANAIDEFWRRLSSQTLAAHIETIFLDSGSSDGTRERIQRLPVSVYGIAPDEFNFGSSCNLMLSLSRAPVVCFLSGHVLLENEKSLETAYSALSGHSNAAAYLRQVPNQLWGTSRYEELFLSHRYPKCDGQVIECSSPAGFSNAGSLLTRASWDRNPFPEIHGSEDYCWAKSHLSLGGRLFYVSSASILHSHRETPDQVFRRVLLNVKARGTRPSYTRAGAYCVGVLSAMLLRGAPLSEAFQYAWAHAQAYLPIPVQECAP